MDINTTSLSQKDKDDLIKEISSLNAQLGIVAGLVSNLPVTVPTFATVDDLVAKYGMQGYIGGDVPRTDGYGRLTPVSLAAQQLGWDIANPYGANVSLFPKVPVGRTMFKMLEGSKPAHGGKGEWDLPKVNTDGSITPGDWREVSDTIVACANGLHVVDAGHINEWLTNDVYVAEVDGPVLFYQNKWIARRARLVRKIEGLNKKAVEDFVAEQFSEFREDTAKSALKDLPADVRDRILAADDKAAAVKIESMEAQAKSYELRADSIRNPDKQKANNVAVHKLDDLVYQLSIIEANRVFTNAMTFDRVVAAVQTRDKSSYSIASNKVAKQVDEGLAAKFLAGLSFGTGLKDGKPITPRIAFPGR